MNALRRNKNAITLGFIGWVVGTLLAIIAGKVLQVETMPYVIMLGWPLGFGGVCIGSELGARVDRKRVRW